MADVCDHAHRYGASAKAAGNAAACGKGAGRSAPYNSVGDRLYSQVHVCNHARCAANDPNYNVKPATPPKKFLVAKSRNHRIYGGRPDPEPSCRRGGGGAAAAAEAKAAKNSKANGRKDVDHHDQSHSLHNLANPGVQAPQGNAGRGGVARCVDIPFSKGQGRIRNQEQDRKLSALAQSVLQHSKAGDSSLKDKKVHPSRSTSNLNQASAIERPKPSIRKAPTPAAAPPGRAAARASPSSRSSGVTESQGEAREQRPQRTRRDNANDSALAPATPATTADQCNVHQWENSASPQSSITSISITQIISTSKRGGDADGKDEEVDKHDEVKVEHHHQQHHHQQHHHHQREGEGEDMVSFASPTASVGSNCDDEIISSFRETEVTVEGDDLDHPVKLNRSTVDISFVPRAVEMPATPLSNGSPTVAAAPSSPTASVATTHLNSSTSESSSTATSTTSSSSKSSSFHPADDDHSPAEAEAATPSIASAPTDSESFNSSITSIPSQARTPSSLTSKPSASTPTSRLISSSSMSGVEAVKAKRAVDDLSRVSSPSPAKKPARTQSCGSPLTPSATSSSSSQLARAFITNLHASSVARKAASSKGVRSIELRGGKARSYSKTTVTSWNVTTTTIEGAEPPNSENSPQQQQPRVSVAPSQLARSGSTPVGRKPSWQSSKENSRANGGSNARNADPKLSRAVGAAGTQLKFARRAKSTTTEIFDELVAESGRASLKHGEVAERRLSEEWMTNHALEGVVKKIADKDHRVKVLVHAFETLASLPDSEGAENGDDNVDVDTQLEYEIVSAAPIAA